MRFFFVPIESGPSFVKTMRGVKRDESESACLSTAKNRGETFAGKEGRKPFHLMEEERRERMKADLPCCRGACNGPCL